MKWHYRIMQDENGEWGVHEAYCDDDELQPHSWTEEPVFAGGLEDPEAVRREIHRLAGDAYRPPISWMWQEEHLDRMLDVEEAECDGSPQCQASNHIHGCYRSSRVEEAE